MSSCPCFKCAGCFACRFQNKETCFIPKKRTFWDISHGEEPNPPAVIIMILRLKRRISVIPELKREMRDMNMDGFRATAQLTETDRGRPGHGGSLCKTGGNIRDSECVMDMC